LAIDSGFRIYFVYAGLSAAYAQAGKMDEAKAALAEARRLNPKLSDHGALWRCSFGRPAQGGAAGG